jgi:hypothetical protein
MIVCVRFPGICKPGYTETFGFSTSCRLESECNDGAAFVIVSVLLGTAVSLWMFYAEPESDGSFFAVVFFYQVAPYFLDTRTSPTAQLLLNFWHFCALRPPYSQVHDGVCLAPGLNAMDMQVLTLFWPFLTIAIPLLVVTVIDHYAYRSQSRHNRSRCISWMLRVAGSAMRAYARLTDTGEAGAGPSEHPLPSNSRLSVALTRFFLLTSTTTVVTLLNLVLCVEVPQSDGSSSLVLLQIPNAACYEGWQVVPFVLLIGCLLLPAVCVWFTWSHVERGADSPKVLSASGLSVLTLLTSPYADRQRRVAKYWESVSFVWRSVLIIAGKCLSMSPVGRVFSVVALAMSLLYAQLMVRPYRSLSAHLVSVLCLVTLTVIGCVQLPMSTTVQNSILPTEGEESALYQTFSTFRVLQGVFAAVPLMALLGSAAYQLHHAHSLRTVRRARSTVASRSTAVAPPSPPLPPPPPPPQEPEELQMSSDVKRNREPSEYRPRDSLSSSLPKELHQPLLAGTDLPAIGEDIRYEFGPRNS